MSEEEQRKLAEQYEEYQKKLEQQREEYDKLCYMIIIITSSYIKFYIHACL